MLPSVSDNIFDDNMIGDMNERVVEREREKRERKNKIKQRGERDRERKERGRKNNKELDWEDFCNLQICVKGK